jgi:glutaconate CoA-transferase subunit A
VNRRSTVISLDDVGDLVSDGDVVGIGGFVTTNKPCALVRQLAMARKRRLTVVAAPSSIELDLMIGLDMVQEVITPYCGAESLAPVAPFYSHYAGRRFRLQEIDNGSLMAMLEAHIRRVPFMPVHVIGTSIVEYNERVRVVENPFKQGEVAVVRPLEIDVALIHAMRADKYGNVQHRGAHFMDHLLAQAAKKVIVQVERVVPNETIRSLSLETSLPCEFVDYVVETPFGAHPAASQGFYRRDDRSIAAYVDAARAHLRGDEQPFDDFVARFIDGPGSHAAYCQAVGVDKVFSLSIEGGGD